MLVNKIWSLEICATKAGEGTCPSPSLELSLRINMQIQRATQPHVVYVAGKVLYCTAVSITQEVNAHFMNDSLVIFQAAAQVGLGFASMAGPLMTSSETGSAGALHGDVYTGPCMTFKPITFTHMHMMVLTTSDSSEVAK